MATRLVTGHLGSIADAEIAIQRIMKCGCNGSGISLKAGAPDSGVFIGVLTRSAEDAELIEQALEEFGADRIHITRASRRPVNTLI